MPHSTKKKRRDYARRYYREHPELQEYRTNYDLLKKYGITSEEKHRMFIEQKGLCGFCNLPMKEHGRGQCCTDHDHETKEVRKLVHGNCNYVIGFFEEHPELISILPVYLKDKICRLHQQNSEPLHTLTQTNSEGKKE